ncbi:MAG TPA: polysaccharide deacetylase family protein [Solirubrobacteraceae bacterium]|nr:polysaccharide deacetylase family protein [Solirubrobacteraceae bacterium]
MRGWVTGACAGGLLVAAVLALASAPGAGAAGRASQPLPIQVASLVQNGHQIVWQVEMTQPFSPGALARAHRALCLLLEPPRSDAVTGEVCLAGPAKRSSQPRLLYSKVSGHHSGPQQPLLATVARTSSRELSASFLPSAVGLGYSDLRWQAVSSLRASACAPPAPGGGSCFSAYPSRPALLKLHVPVLSGCVASGPSLVYHGPLKGREIALTFDDGPWSDPPTIDFVHVLAAAHVPATFFEIGRQIPLYDPTGSVERKMLADGDMIGDHSWSHPDVAALSPAGQRAQLLDAVDAIRHATRGFTPCLWRPPYGDISPSLIKLARSLGLVTVMWNVDPRDWALPGVNAIYDDVIANAHPGDIVIQHFGGGPREETLAALPREIATLRRRGYQFVTVAQMLGLKLVYR